MAGAFQNMERLSRKLKSMPTSVKARMRDAGDKNADELLRTQKALANRNRRSGRTIASLDKREGDHELQVVVFSDYRPARYEEFGTSVTPAIPFFFPPYRTLRKKFKGRYSRAINDGVKEALSRGR